MAVAPAQPLGLPAIGSTLDGKYEIVRLLGEGGMAYVFEASHKRLEQRVAIKMLSPDLSRDAELVTRFEREARAMGKLATRHIVRVMDVEETPEGLPYLVMELLAGRDLEAEIQQRKKLPIGESIDIVLQACQGMLEAHSAGIVHRDLKPANLFLTVDRESQERIVKILDFGISKMVGDGESSRLTGVGAVMGTVLYMSPEQVRAESNVDVRADVWSIGVILYEILAGRAPFEGSSPQIAQQIVGKDAPEIRTFEPSVPEGVALSLRRMLERDRARRFPSLVEVIQALAPFAPPASVGAAIGAKHSFATTTGPGKTVALQMKHTMPMAPPNGVERAPFKPPVPPSSQQIIPRSPAPSSASSVARHSVASMASVTLPAPPARRSRGPLFVLALVVGFLGAAGVVLIIVAYARRSVAVLTPGAPPPTTSASARQGVAVPRSATAAPATTAAPAPSSSL